MHKLFASLFLLLSLNNAIAACGPTWADRAAEPGQKAVALLQAGNYADLEKLLASYRSTEQFDPSGYGLIFGIYANLSGPSIKCRAPRATPEVLAARRALFDAWVRAQPNSPSLLIALGNHQVFSAWQMRGNGTASTVSTQQFEQLKQNMELARKTLERVKPSDRDAGWYYAMLNVGLEQHFSPAKYDALYQQAVKRYPRYHELVSTAMDYYQPYWHGSDEEHAAFVERAVKRTRAAMGEAMYTRLHYQHLQPDMYTDGTTNWLRMKSGMRRIVKDFPSTENFNRFARQACAAQDEQAMKTAFALAGENTNFPDIWESDTTLSYCKYRQNGRAECFRFKDNKGVMCYNIDKNGMQIVPDEPTPAAP